MRGKTTVYEFPHPHWCWDCDIIIVMDGGVVQQPVGTMETEGETHNSVPNYEIITITFLQIRTIRSVFTACGDKWYQWISSFLSLNTYNPVITKTDFTSIIFIINDMNSVQIPFFCVSFRFSAPTLLWVTDWLTLL